MNEELSIIINAITSEANKNLEGVKKKLNEIKNTGDNTGKSVSVSMAALAKGTAVATAAITGLTVAFVALGKSSMEFRKEQAKLNAAFEAMGSSADQAATTYKELYRFLGDAQQSTEAAQNLSKITTEEKALAEWTKILQGVYASFGASLPVESLAEAANETIKVGQVTGAMADALNWLGVSEDAFNEKLANTTSLAEREALTRSVLNSLYGNSAALYERNNKALLNYNESQLQLDYSLAKATEYTVPLMTALNQLASTVLDILSPAFEYVAATIVAFVQWVMAAIKAVTSFFGIFTDSSSADTTKDIADNMSAISTNVSNSATGLNNVTSGLEDANKEATKLKKQLMGFDELNVVSTQKPVSTSPGVGGGGDVGAISTPDIAIPKMDLGNLKVPGLDDFEDKVARIKEYITPIAVAVGAIAAGLALWTLLDFIQHLMDADRLVRNITDIVGKYTPEAFEKAFGKSSQQIIDDANAKKTEMLNTIKKIGGELLTVGGAIVAVAGYSNAWVDGVGWGNLAATIGGLAAAITGIGLLFGPLGAQIGVIVGALAAMVLGVKDFINQGPTVQNTILIWGGALAAAIALATMGVGPLIAAIVGLVAAIGATTAAILLEEPAIKSVTDAQAAHQAAIEAVMDAEMNYVNVMDQAEATMKRLEEAEKAAGMSGEELYKQVQDGTITYSDMTDEQKELYKAYMENEKAQKAVEDASKALEEAKKAERRASYESQLALAKESGSYDDFKTSVVEAYKAGELSAEEARDLIELAMSEMSDSAQTAFMEDIPADIKEGMNPHKYESTKTKIVKFFQNMWQSIKNVFADLKQWFSEIGTKIGTALSNAAKTAVNWILEKAVGLINGFLSSINWAIGFINKIPGVNISKITLLEVPRLAEGGIVTGSTLANIGERGKEAVLPLENNTEWMDVLADRIAARSSAPSKIVLKVGEKELGWASINGINQITKQTGGLQLQLV